MSNSTDKRWPTRAHYRSEIELEIYKLQARLICDPDERRDIEARIEELRAQLNAPGA